jgi:ribosome modulation factor
MYLERFTRGEHVAVWQEIGALDEMSLELDVLEDVNVVAVETMRRVKRNLERITERLRGIGYRFGTSGSSFEDAPLQGLQNAEALLTALSAAVGGTLPLTYSMFIIEVGDVDLRGTHPSFTSEYLLDAFVFGTYVPDAEEIADGLEQAEPGEDGIVRYEHAFSPDSYHKEDISGGTPYIIALPDDRIDPPVLDTHLDDATLVEYLRDCLLEHGGFPGFVDMPADLRALLTGDLERF